MSPSLAGFLKDAVRRIISSDDDLDEEEAAQPSHDAQPIASALLRHEVTVRGEIESLTATSDHHLKTCEAVLFDGTGRVNLIWMGRKHIPGIGIGVQMRVRGRLARSGARLVVYNPKYDIIAETTP